MYGPLWDLAGVLFLVEASLFALVYLPVFLYRALIKREPVRLAAARATFSLAEAIGFA